MALLEGRVLTGDNPVVTVAHRACAWRAGHRAKRVWATVEVTGGDI